MAERLIQRAKQLLGKHTVRLTTETHDIVPPDEDLDEYNFILETRTEITLGDDVDGAEAEIHAGSISAVRVLFGLADQVDGPSYCSVLDAHSQELEEYSRLLHPEEEYWSEAVGQVFDLTIFDPDLLAITSVTIEEAYRGSGVGLIALRRFIDVFGGGCGLVAMKPFPHQYAGCLDADAPAERRAAFEAARLKLREYWSRLGFRSIPDTDLYALAPGLRNPGIWEALGKSERPHTDQAKVRARHPAKSKRAGAAQ